MFNNAEHSTKKPHHPLKGKVLFKNFVMLLTLLLKLFCVCLCRIMKHNILQHCYLHFVQSFLMQFVLSLFSIPFLFCCVKEMRAFGVDDEKISCVGVVFFKIITLELEWTTAMEKSNYAWE